MQGVPEDIGSGNGVAVDAQPSLSAGERLRQRSRRIALICGHFMPEVGYQEVWMARTLARLGQRVRVITSTRVSMSARKVLRTPYPAGHSVEPDGCELLRLRPLAWFRSAVWAPGVAAALEEFRPELLLLLGVGKLFGVRDTLRYAQRTGTPLIAVFSELEEYRLRHTPYLAVRAWLQDLGFALLKQRVYRQVVQHARLLVCNMPATQQWLLQRCRTDAEREQVRTKARVLSLGYDRERYFFDPAARQEMRRQWGCTEQEVVLLTITRLEPYKGLERVIAAVGQLQRQGLPVRYILVGGLQDGYQQQMVQFLAQQPQPERFTVVPFQPAEVVRRYACGADLGIWMQPAISTQEAMGTGLPVLLPNRDSLLHLLQEGVTGWYWDEPDGFEQRLQEVVVQLSGRSEPERCRERQRLAHVNAQRFSYEAILEEVFDLAGLL